MAKKHFRVTFEYDGRLGIAQKGLGDIICDALDNKNGDSIKNVEVQEVVEE